MWIRIRMKKGWGGYTMRQYQVRVGITSMSDRI
jgi:hypothetical protein